MNTSGEVADLMAKEAIQMTESAVKLTALGVKTLRQSLWRLQMTTARRRALQN